ncbi:uncharacterized protein C9orf43 homolog [Protopterus annectens]|uniref:uncharacterized protein C9orf43 homolog n=1 Tax=Protopterus annectens TaxID=7888 RepID=UPI001CF9ED64|nr:uncharacterized protein C9orf43 homolog [Protopterus annectens]
MFSVDLDSLDETTCNMVVCQHPSCWESIRRLYRGCPRFFSMNRNFSSEDTSENEDGLPTLKITDLTSSVFSSDGTQPFCMYKAYPTEKKCHPFHFQSLSRSFADRVIEESMERLHFPGMNSPQNFQSFLQKSQSNMKKLEVMECTENESLGHSFPSTGNSSFVVWVPNKQWKPFKDEHDNLKSAGGICVKELILDNLQRDSGCYGAVQESDAEMKRQKTRKVPTGGQPYNLHFPGSHSQTNRFVSSPLQMKGHDTVPSYAEIKPVSRRVNPRLDNVLQPKKEDISEVPCGSFPSLKQVEPKAFTLENRRIILHDSKEKKMNTLLAENMKCVYKLDKMPSATQKRGGVKLASIRNQPYLWKKYVSVAGSSGIIDTSGSLLSHYQQQSRGFSRSLDPNSNFGFYPSLVGTAMVNSREPKEDQSAGLMTPRLPSPSIEKLSDFDENASTILATGSVGSCETMAEEDSSSSTKHLLHQPSVKSKFISNKDLKTQPENKVDDGAPLENNLYAELGEGEASCQETKAEPCHPSLTVDSTADILQEQLCVTEGNASPLQENTTDKQQKQHMNEGPCPDTPPPSPSLLNSENEEDNSTP